MKNEIVLLPTNYQKRFSRSLLTSSSLALKIPTEADVLLYLNFPCHLVALQIHGLLQTYTSTKQPQKIHKPVQIGQAEELFFMFSLEII